MTKDGGDSPDNAMATSCTKEYRMALFQSHLKEVIQDINGILKDHSHEYSEGLESALLDLRTRCRILSGTWDDLLKVGLKKE